MEINKAFGQVVRNARKERKFSQEQLAELSGMHVNHISFIERAKPSPSLQAMQQISAALGIKLSTMLEAAENLVNTD